MDSNPLNFLYGGIAILLAFIFVLPSVAMSWPIGLISQGVGYMGVFFHELGHTLFSWVFGMPAIPMFDFKNGGGWSLSLTGHSIPAQIAVLCTVALFLYYQKDMIYPNVMKALILFWIVFGVIGFTDFYEDVILFMGHETVAILGGFMLARGFYGVFLTRREERWLNVFVGAFFIVDQVKMCDSLLHDVEYQMQYEAQKGGHGMGDLTRIANNHLWTQDSVAIFLMVFTIAMAVIIPAVVGILLKVYRTSQ